MIDHIAYHTQLTEVVEVLLNSQLWKMSIWTAGHVMGIPMDPAGLGFSERIWNDPAIEGWSFWRAMKLMKLSPDCW